VVKACGPLLAILNTLGGHTERAPDVAAIRTLAGHTVTLLQSLMRLALTVGELVWGVCNVECKCDTTEVPCLVFK